jgi:hypothetical protein
MTLSRLSRPARTEAAALAVAAVGIIIQIIGGVNYPAVPPGLIILLAAAALVAFLPWRWPSGTSAWPAHDQPHRAGAARRTLARSRRPAAAYR